MKKPVLTKEVINEKIRERKIQLVGEYINLKTKTSFKCEFRHVWESKPNNILYAGNGCPFCFGNAKLKTEQINKVLFPRNIEIIGKYINAQTKCSFFCRKCSNIWDSTPNNILKGRGCPKCYSIQKCIPKEVIEDQLSQKNIKIVGNFINTSSKTSFECEFGHIWETTPCHILKRNTFCPVCAKLLYKYGVDYSLPGILYYIVVENVYYKIGITSKTIEQRFTKNDLQKIKIIKEIKFNKLIEAFKEEQRILREFNDFLYKGPKILSSGNSEIFIKNILYMDSFLSGA